MGLLGFQTIVDKTLFLSIRKYKSFASLEVGCFAKRKLNFFEFIFIYNLPRDTK